MRSSKIDAIVPSETISDLLAVHGQTHGARVAGRLKIKNLSGAHGELAARRAALQAAEEAGCLVYESTWHVRAFADCLADGLFGACEGYVYIAGADASNAPVKIGTAVDLRARLKSIQCANPERISLFASFHGDATVERMLHVIFARDRLRGEWFRRSATIAEFVSQLRKKCCRERRMI